MQLLGTTSTTMKRSTTSETHWKCAYKLMNRLSIARCCRGLQLHAGARRLQLACLQPLPRIRSHAWETEFKIRIDNSLKLLVTINCTMRHATQRTQLSEVDFQRPCDQSTAGVTCRVVGKSGCMKCKSARKHEWKADTNAELQFC
jgi:hypothetical protein